MNIVLASVGTVRARGKTESTGRLLAEYIQRAGRYMPMELILLNSEGALFEAVERSKGRTSAHLVLLDPRGKALSSVEFAGHLAGQQEAGTQRVMLCVGPADGWSEGARQQAHLLFSLGRITLPHELARVVLAEQVYRALTILAGHPYHTGH